MAHSEGKSAEPVVLRNGTERGVGLINRTGRKGPLERVLAVRFSVGRSAVRAPAGDLYAVPD